MSLSCPFAYIQEQGCVSQEYLTSCFKAKPLFMNKVRPSTLLQWCQVFTYFNYFISIGTFLVLSFLPWGPTINNKAIALVVILHKKQ